MCIMSTAVTDLKRLDRVTFAQGQDSDRLSLTAVWDWLLLYCEINSAEYQILFMASCKL